jgi:hypothetical protein
MYHIGDILVFKGEPIDNNPYKGGSICGNERKAALTAFKNNQATITYSNWKVKVAPELETTISLKNYTFWYAPSCGGAKKVTNPKDIHWASSGV